MSTVAWLIIITLTPTRPVDEKTIDVLSDKFDVLDWSIAVDPGGFLSVTAYFNDDTPPWKRIPDVIALVQGHLEDAGVAAEVVKTEAVTEERRDWEAERPQIPTSCRPRTSRRSLALRGSAFISYRDGTTSLIQWLSRVTAPCGLGRPSTRSTAHGIVGPVATAWWLAWELSKRPITCIRTG